MSKIPIFGPLLEDVTDAIIVSVNSRVVNVMVASDACNFMFTAC